MSRSEAVSTLARASTHGAHGADRVELLSGWGRTSPSSARVARPGSAAEVEELVAGVGEGGLIARGAGRSYGDAAQNAGGLVLDTTALRGPISLDAERGLITATAGTTFAELLARLAASDLTLPVVPGTRYLTVGGAIAADVHGKNHPRDGSLARHLESFALCTPAGGLVRVSAETPDLFAATLGGMGMTGVIVEATLRTRAMPSARVRAQVRRTRDLSQAIAVMSEHDAHRYAIAWVDLLSGGPRFGRCVVTRSDDGDAEPTDSVHTGAHATGTPRAAPLRARPLASVPSWFPESLLRPATVKAFNRWHWRSAPTRHAETELGMSANLFPLDALGDWNRLYGRGGLLQYQFVLPAGQEETLLGAVDELRRARVPMYLAVLKRFGAPSGGLLSFPIEGWTMAIDIPASAPGLHARLDALDERLADAGGRIYLAKDSRTRAETLRHMYPQLERFLRIRAELDPHGRLRSDMGRRLGLCE